MTLVNQGKDTKIKYITKKESVNSTHTRNIFYGIGKTDKQSTPGLCQNKSYLPNKNFIYKDVTLVRWTRNALCNKRHFAYY